MTGIMTTPDPATTGGENDVTVSTPSPSTVVTGTTTVSTTLKENAGNATSNITVIMTTTDIDTTGVEKDVTSSTSTTSTIEDTPPASGHELDYSQEYSGHSGIHLH
jgi:hypothetical protein